MPKKKLKDRAAQILNQLFIGLDDDIQEVKPLDLKEKLAQKRKAKEARQKIFSVLGLTVVFAILVGLPLAISVGPKMAVIASVAFPCFLLCFSYPRTALWIFLIYMPFSGTVTYSIGAGNALFQLSKDAFYIPALIALVLECRRRRLPILIPKKLLPTLGILLFSCLLTLFFVNGMQQFLISCDTLVGNEKFLRDASGNFILNSQGLVILTPCRSGIPFFQGLLGLKVLLGYVPLIFCVQYLITDSTIF